MPDQPETLWRTAILYANHSRLETLLAVAKLEPPPLNTKGLSTVVHIPRIEVTIDDFHQLATDQASCVLGVTFEPSGQFVTLTALQFSLLCYATSLGKTNTEGHLQSIRRLLRATSSCQVNYDFFGNNSNVVHLAAFLHLGDMLELLLIHGGDITLLNGCGLSPRDIVENGGGTQIVQLLSGSFTSVSTSSDDTEIESRALGYFDYRIGHDSNDKDGEDDSLTAADSSWDLTDHSTKYDDSSMTNGVHFDNAPTTTYRQASPPLHDDMDDTIRSKNIAFRETRAIPLLNHIYLDSFSGTSQSIHNFPYYKDDTLTSESPAGDSESESESRSESEFDNDEDSSSASSLSKVFNKDSPNGELPRPLYSAMRPDRRFGCPTANYLEYLSTLDQRPRTSAQHGGLNQKSIQWNPLKKIIVFKRHLTSDDVDDDDDDDDDEDTDEDDQHSILSFQRTWVYLEHEPTMLQDEPDAIHPSDNPLTPGTPSSLAPQNDHDIQEVSPLAASFYGLCQTNVSQFFLPENNLVLKSPIPSRPLPAIPNESSLKRNGDILSVVELRKGMVLKSPPPRNRPMSPLSNTPPILAKLLRNLPRPIYHGGAVKKDVSERMNDASQSKSSQSFLQDEVSLSSTSAAATASTSTISLGCLDKELPTRSEPLSKAGTKAFSSLLTAFREKFSSPPTSPTMGYSLDATTSVSSMSLLSPPRMPMSPPLSNRRSSLSLDMSLNCSMESVKPFIYAPIPRKEVSQKVKEVNNIITVTEINNIITVRDANNKPGEVNEANKVCTVNKTNDVGSHILQADSKKPCHTTELFRRDSDIARSPQLYPHQQSQQPAVLHVERSTSNLLQRRRSRSRSKYFRAGGDKGLTLKPDSGVLNDRNVKELAVATSLRDTSASVPKGGEAVQDDMELFHGILHSTLDDNDKDVSFTESVLFSIQGVNHGLPVGVLFLRIKSVIDFVLPVPAEGAMVSVRIDTGLEKVDTDYVQLKDIDIIFNQEFCIPVTPDLSLTMTLHLMQAPHIQPLSNSVAFAEDIRLEDPLMSPPSRCYQPEFNERVFTGLVRSPESTLSWRNAASTLSSRTSRSVALLLQKQFSQRARSNSSDSSSHYSGSGSQVSFECTSRGTPHPEDSGNVYWSSAGRGNMNFDGPGHQSTVSLASVTKSAISKWKRNILPSRKRSDLHRQTKSCISVNVLEAETATENNSRAIGYPRQLRGCTNTEMPQVQNDFSQQQHHQHSHQVFEKRHCPPLLSLETIHRTETPLQILSRHVLFEDENCIARSGITFEDLRPSCVNQIVRVEFMAVNSWVDLKDYSRMEQSYSQGQRSKNAVPIGGQPNNNVDNDDGEKKRDESVTAVCKILTSLCFLPGHAMDAEDAIDDENTIPLEPQNMLECQQGLYYFQWQGQTSFQGALYFMTENRMWRKGMFKIVGSRLWRCQEQGTSEMEGDDNDAMEKIEYLDLITVRSIQTSVDRFTAIPSYRYAPGNDLFTEDDNRDGDCSPFYPVQNAFRLHMVTSKEPFIPCTQDFYAESPESAQSWVSALLSCCLNRPQKPYWL
ncbi:hypothetical protein BGZ94_009590 [Podila epigama]|nr:hypothetical protein BGZ94_009590 [Podila epigama]